MTRRSYFVVMEKRMIGGQRLVGIGSSNEEVYGTVVVGTGWLGAVLVLGVVVVFVGGVGRVVIGDMS
jgi:hypothetical protein